MICADFHDRLAELEGLAASGARRNSSEIEQHVEECPSCSRVWHEWQQWQQLELPRLPLSIEPPRDLWPAISDRLVGGELDSPAPKSPGPDRGALAPPDRVRWRPARAMTLLAASVLLLAGLGLVWRVSRSGSGTGRDSTGQDRTDRDRASQEAANLERPVEVTAEANDAADLAYYEDRLISQRKELMSAVAAKGAILEPALAASLESDVRALNDAIGGIRLAMVESPDDARLHRMLAERYRQEARLLRAVQRI